MKLNLLSLFIIAVLGWSLKAVGQDADSLSVRSPNGELVWRFSLQDLDGGTACASYNFTYKSKELISWSKLGLVAHPQGFNTTSWHSNFKLLQVSHNTVDTVHENPFGEVSRIRDWYREMVVDLQQLHGRKATMQIVIRAYNEGVAFCYRFPEEMATQILEIADEATFFSLSPEAKAWHTPIAQAEYRLVPLNNWEKHAELPLTVQIADSFFLCIATAAQIEYSRARLTTTAVPGTLKTSLYGEVVGTSPFQTPWRVLIPGTKPTTLANNNFIIWNLNPPAAIKNTSWIKPGTVMREVTLSTEGAKALVDFAVQQQIDYVHFDAGWYGYEYHVNEDASTVTVDPRRNPKRDLDLQEAVRYATEKGKRVMVYVNHRALEKQLDSLLPLYKNWGISGIKFGFVHTGSHRYTTWLHDAVKKAAQYELVVDVHDEYRPTGFSRTYPNLLTQEGVLGNEGFPDAVHNTILPFTRFIAGAGDYTFCFNTETMRPGKSKTTQAHQLALPIIYHSPLQFLFWYGKPSDFPNIKDAAFWKGLPTVWDETRMLDGSPGTHVVTARRKGTTWYVGAITSETRTIQVPLGFLPKQGRYQLYVHEDDGKGGIKQSFRTVRANDMLTLRLQSTGGAALKLEKL